MTNRCLLSLSAVALSAFVLSGCQIWYQLFPPKLNDKKEILTAWNAGSAAVAAKKACENAEKSRDKLEDDLVWHFDAGAISVASGNYAQSEACLEWASEIVVEQPMPGTRKKLVYAVEDELAATLSGDGDLAVAGSNLADAAVGEGLALWDSAKTLALGGNTYQCGNAERIMLPLYRSYNSFGLKDAARSVVALKNLQEYQAAAKDANLKQLEMDKVALSNKKMDEEVALLDKEMKAIYGEDFVLDRAAEAEGVYVNPFGYWLNGVYFLNKGEDRDDLSLAADSLRLAVLTNGKKSKLLAEDLLAAENAAIAGRPLEENSVYIVYEGGSIPKKSEKEVKVRVPLFALAVGNALAVKGGGAPVIPTHGTIFLSTLISQGAVPPLDIQGMETVMDLEAAANKELLNNAELQLRESLDQLAGMAIARGSAVVSAKRYYEKMEKAAREESDSKKKKEKIKRAELAKAAWDAARVAVALPLIGDHKDCRSWETLPREIRLAKIATPENGIVSVGGVSTSVNKNGVNIVRVRKVSADGKPMINVFSFKDIVEPTEK